MLIIRRAKPDDIENLQKLNQEVFIDNHKYDDDLRMDWAISEKGKKYFTRLVKDKNSVCLMAFADGKPVAYIACGLKDFDYRKSKNLELQNMGTIPEYRSKGIGSKLIMKVKEWGKRQGFKRIYVNSYFHNHRAIKFYKKNAFAEIDLSLEMKI
ncbi:hypothetical protein A2774_01950 [Candidatus Roizmanbacteria bacterium RIFCSPHIGHO2_01_FULL_39_12c]|uniref:N-acetyltransferase domain-containing protein n=1 Tax=Candidatus Roizmanbacteria bacterium RIFCSPHIGHO2_01_FULL_39_12c TaxID=1802031 RepID=A0A1F7GE07_9BACT|nr:MAG: hypothetical protein A2774_01950 [Candidatus Roizmanbacteria bacterium RIFCSPHIGHO2_01_FULL_39_12c]